MTDATAPRFSTKPGDTFIYDNQTREELSHRSAAFHLNEQANRIAELEANLAKEREERKGVIDDALTSECERRGLRIVELEGRLETVRQAFEEERLLKNEARALCDHRSSDSWIWMEDILENDLKSMSDGMAVNITAGRLRRLVEWEVDRIVKWMADGYAGVDQVVSFRAYGVTGLLRAIAQAVTNRLYRNPESESEPLDG